MINTLMQAGVPTTTFRPVIFMDNLLTDWARRDILENNIPNKFREKDNNNYAINKKFYCS